MQRFIDVSVLIANATEEMEAFHANLQKVMDRKPNSSSSLFTPATSHIPLSEEKDLLAERACRILKKRIETFQDKGAAFYKEEIEKAGGSVSKEREKELQKELDVYYRKNSELSWEIKELCRHFNEFAVRAKVQARDCFDSNW